MKIDIKFVGGYSIVTELSEGLTLEDILSDLNLGGFMQLNRGVVFNTQNVVYVKIIKEAV